MSATNSARNKNAVQNADTTATTTSNMRPDLLPRERIQGSVDGQTGDIKMRDAMRLIVWITGVAFGVAAPGVFAQGAPDTSVKQKNLIIRKLDTNRDGSISRDEAKQNAAINAAFSQADMNKDGKLDEDELIKALSISQREKVASMALETGSAAKQYVLDSEITAKVKAALLGEEGLRSLEVSVQTHKGKVQLAGFVDSKDQIARAGTIAARETGVQSVLNNLTVK